MGTKIGALREHQMQCRNTPWDLWGSPARRTAAFGPVTLQRTLLRERVLCLLILELEKPFRGVLLPSPHSLLARKTARNQKLLRCHSERRSACMLGVGSG